MFLVATRDTAYLMIQQRLEELEKEWGFETQSE
jgi:hypothetical protein